MRMSYTSKTSGLRYFNRTNFFSRHNCVLSLDSTQVKSNRTNTIISMEDPIVLLLHFLSINHRRRSHVLDLSHHLSISYIAFAPPLVHCCNLPIIWSSRSRSGCTICVNVEPFHCDGDDWADGCASGCWDNRSSGVASILNFIVV